MIKESFVSCAIAASVSGSDDHKIHCFKEGQPCAEGKEKLDEVQRVLHLMMKIHLLVMMMKKLKTMKLLLIAQKIVRMVEILQ